MGELESVVSEASTSRSAEALQAPVRESQRVAAAMMREFPDLSRRTRHVLQRAGIVSAHALLAMSGWRGLTSGGTLVLSPASQRRD